MGTWGDTTRKRDISELDMDAVQARARTIAAYCFPDGLADDEFATVATVTRNDAWRDPNYGGEPAPEAFIELDVAPTRTVSFERLWNTKTLRINGEAYRVEVEPQDTYVDCEDRVAVSEYAVTVEPYWYRVTVTHHLPAERA